MCWLASPRTWNSLFNKFTFISLLTKWDLFKSMLKYQCSEQSHKTEFIWIYVCLWLENRLSGWRTLRTSPWYWWGTSVTSRPGQLTPSRLRTWREATAFPLLRPQPKPDRWECSWRRPHVHMHMHAHTRTVSLCSLSVSGWEIPLHVLCLSESQIKDV